MAEPEIRVRAVRGRVVDPYRGSVDLDQPERFTPREAEPQPLAAIVERLREVPETTFYSKGRRFVIERKAQRVRMAFASAAPRVSLEDASIGGDGLLAIDILYTLLPLVGAFEIRIGGYHDLIDGHEPAPDVVARYDNYWIAESLRLAREL